MSRLTHGLAESSEFHTWASIKQRCLNPNCARYADYGGRGIKICDEWKDSFENFLKDMGSRPSSKHSIDRVDNNGDYKLSNCRWATAKEQANNRKSNIMIDDLTLMQYCEKHNLNYRIINQRISRDKWSIKDAINIPIGKLGSKKPK